jgi:hypothetical protein
VCDGLLTPYCAVCYHLAEWGHAGVWWVVYIYMTFTNKYQAKEQGGTLQSLACIGSQCHRTHLRSAQTMLRDPFATPCI